MKNKKNTILWSGKAFIFGSSPSPPWTLSDDWTSNYLTVSIICQKLCRLLASTMSCTHPSIYLAMGIHAWIRVAFCDREWSIT